MKKIIAIFAAIALLTACSYEDKPPKTDDASTNYVLPEGEVPTEEEIALVNAARAEYQQAIEN